MKKLIIYLICFILGFIISINIYNSFKVGSVATPTPIRKNNIYLSNKIYLPSASECGTPTPPSPSPGPSPGPSPPSPPPGPPSPPGPIYSRKQIITKLGISGSERNNTEKLKVIYINSVRNHGWVDIKNACDAGYNIIILTFFEGGQATDMTSQWEQLSDTDKQECIKYIHSKDTLLMISFGGAYQCPEGCGELLGGCKQHDFPFCPASRVQDSTLCDFEYEKNAPSSRYLDENLYDGLDLDLENFSKGNTQPCTQKTIEYIQNIKQSFNNNFVISSAPQSPHFVGYTLNFVTISQYLDFIIIQFYNNDPGGCNQNYKGWLFSNTSKTGEWGANNIKKILSLGIPANKIVVGKCGQGCNLNESYMGGNFLLDQLDTMDGIKLKGVMFWEWYTGLAKSGNKWLQDDDPGCN